MAGSYQHLLDDENGKGGWSMIENMHDARMCVEQLWWLVERAIGEPAARKLLDDEFYPMEREEIPRDAAMEKVKSGMSN